MSGRFPTWAGAAVVAIACACAMAAPAGSATSAPRTAVVSVTDNAFFRGAERPTVRLRPGGVMTWRWRGKSSHQVTVASGPQRVRSSTRTSGRFSVRLRRSGRYRIVCPLHAPGMRMTIVVG
jgi:plastocyanin